MESNQKLYVISRRDLSPGAQAVQGMHAMREFAAQFKELENEWYSKSNFLCFLSVANEADLESLLLRAQKQGIKCSYFKEPAFDNALTGVCLEPSPKSRDFCTGLPLCLVEFSEKSSR